MIRRSGASGLSRTGEFDDGELNPMDGLTNLVDVMLVFACGIMLALIINWNVDVGGTAGKPVNVDETQEISELEGLANEQDSNLAASGGYENYGVVYRDKKTGALYVVTDTEQGQ